LSLALPPVLVLALLLILLGTQVAYLVAPKAPHYLVRLGLSTLAVTMGEALALAGLGSRLALGELHPVTDLVLLVLLQWAGGRWIVRQPV
jgi:hypothetical protein